MGLARFAWILGLALWVGACGGSADVSNGNNDGVGGTGQGGEGPGNGTGGALIDGKPKPDTCTPKTCKELGKNCGKVADGCGDILDCGSCDSGLPCGAFEPNVCATADDYSELCQPQSKEEACAGKECGVEGDGCGNYYECGTCDADQTCGLEAAFQCGDNPVFTDEECPARIESCADVGVACGVIGNGCGDGTLDCDAELGGCGDGEFCGLGGPNQCGAPVTCNAFDPAVACAGKCGIVSDGCDSTIDCSALFPCPDGQTCGGGGVANQCGSGVGSCTQLSRDAACAGRTCGMVGDGCDGFHFCGDDDGTCPGDLVCRNGSCETGCVALTQEEACENKECGTASDGCGSTVTCGSGCGEYEQCGFLTPFTCDLNPDLVPPEECKAADPADACGGKQCGIVFDGCGTDPENQIDCSVVNGGCEDGEFCGLKTPFQCDAPEQEPCDPGGNTSCAAMGWACGIAVNECGETFDCAAEGRTCSGAETCIGGLDGSPTACVGADCEVCGAIPSCSEDQPTVLTGRVITPGQKDDQTDNHVGVPNAFVYILRTTDENDLPDFADGVPTNGTACDRCGEQELGPVLVSAITDAEGRFTLRRNIPVDQDFLLVVKAGKFRRAQVWKLDSDAACSTTHLPTTMAGGNPTRLPRHSDDGVAVNIPRIAISTGAIDAMECVFYKMGIAASEMTRPQLDGRIHLYRSNGAWPDQDSSSCSSANNNSNIRDRCPGCQNCGNGGNPSCSDCKTNYTDAIDPVRLYGSDRRINDYDMTVFDCEGGSWDSSLSRDSRRVREYANRGGRVFASHLSNTWLHANADKSSNGSTPYNSATPFNTGLGPASTWDTGYGTLYASGTGQIAFSDLVTPWWPWPAQPSPRIDNFAAWMVSEGITSGPNYTFELTEPRSMSIEPGEHSEVFVRVTNNNQRVQQFSFNTPYGAPQDATCGRVAYSGFHVAAAGTGGTSPFTNQVFPNHCTGSIGNNGNLTDQEKILLYMLFDLGACVGDEPEPPECEPLECPGDNTCGVFADGCGGTLDCGCSDGEACVNGTCQDVDCVPDTCGDLTCTTISDGCGGMIECECPICEPTDKDEACEGMCGFVSNGCDGVHACDEACPPECEPLTACPPELDCGVISDGCNATLFCGECELPEVCGGAGSHNVCGVPECEPLTCESLGAQCGYIGDGCGGSDYCGDCQAGQVCTTVDGVPNQCDGCVPLTCADVGAECGVIGDGCGGTVECGSCPGGKVCGAQSPNQCGDGPSCTPRTCADAGAECGVIGDGCGGTVTCPACPAGKVCGIDAPFQCGDPPPCVKATCESLDAECGVIGDGCGGLLECGACPAGGVCGTNQPNRCSGVIR